MPQSPLDMEAFTHWLTNQRPRTRIFPGKESVFEHQQIEVDQLNVKIPYLASTMLSKQYSPHQTEGSRYLSNSKRDKIDRILGRLVMIYAQRSLVYPGDEQCHGGFASWYRDDVALMGSYRAGTSRNHDIITIRSADRQLSVTSVLPMTSRVFQIFSNSARVVENNDRYLKFLNDVVFRQPCSGNRRQVSRGLNVNIADRYCHGL